MQKYYKYGGKDYKKMRNNHKVTPNDGKLRCNDNTGMS